MTPLTSACLCVVLFFFCAVDSASSDKKLITPESGQDVTMTCAVPQGKTIRAVKWSRADLGDKYVLLYQDGQLDPENQHPSFKNRVDLQNRQMKDGDVSLILKAVTSNDDGSYKCRVLVSESASWEIMGTVNMSVGLPGQPQGLTDVWIAIVIGITFVAAFGLCCVGLFIYYKCKNPRNRVL
ncbi:butyrophilin-like protein 9 [Oreochromis aureus]|uniref:butyrophilin-like protein 9 n=1 Tax=Oreochromis aureus TaxID=47969 RepID=UPI0012BC8BA1|nr:butyrophilin-like protein 9 [Oreochromis aureus]